MYSRNRVPPELICAVKRHQVLATRFLLSVGVARQSMRLFEKSKNRPCNASFPNYTLRNVYLISTSAYGVGQVMNSKQTPIGLHRVARKIGGGQPIGTVFKGRRPAGLTWQGPTDAAIVHRILWLEGLEPGFNRGGKVDSFNRYIYIHGFGDETTLGRPFSHGCIHLSATDLIPLFDLLPIGTLVWIAAA